MNLRIVLVLVMSMAGGPACGMGRLFSVNLYGYGKTGADRWDQESWRETVRLDPTDADRTAGVWETEEWQNILAYKGATTISASDGTTTATLELRGERISAPYWWQTVRSDSNSVDVGNATLLDGHFPGTEYDIANGDGLPFPAKVCEFNVSGIPFQSYDVIVYFGASDAQFFDGSGRIRINDRIPADPANMSGGWSFRVQAQKGEPTGVLAPITSDGGTGNYILYRGLTEPTFRAQVWGSEFTHIGPAGFQIRESFQPKNIIFGLP